MSIVSGAWRCYTNNHGVKCSKYFHAAIYRYGNILLLCCLWAGQVLLTCSCIKWVQYALIELLFFSPSRSLLLTPPLLLHLSVCLWSVENPYDYMGRSYLHVPQDTDVDLRTDEPPDKCYAPKKFIHQWLVSRNFHDYVYCVYSVHACACEQLLMCVYMYATYCWVIVWHAPTWWKVQHFSWSNEK